LKKGKSLIGLAFFHALARLAGRLDRAGFDETVGALSFDKGGDARLRWPYSAACRSVTLADAVRSARGSRSTLVRRPACAGWGVAWRGACLM